MIMQWTITALLAVAIGVIGNQPAKPVPKPESHADVQEVVHLEQATLAEQDEEITALEMQLQHEQDVSRGVGLLELSPGTWETGWVATWYAEGGINGNGVTATGKRTTDQWTVAVDPTVIPLGSLVEVRFPNGDTRVYQALDTGGAIKGKRIDIYDPSVGRCFKNGRQQVEVRILDRGR